MNKTLWKTIRVDRCFDNKWIKVDKETVLLPDKKKIDFYIIKGQPVVAVLGITKGNKVLLVDQYRQAIKKNMIDLPGGRVEKEETLKEAAKREFFEETGWEISKLRKLTSFYFDPGRSDKQATIFIGTAKPGDRKRDVDSTENTSVYQKNFHDLWQEVTEDKIKGTTLRLAIFSLYFSKHKSAYIR
ncbi:MAG: NUDIX hydrolase [Candidatus Shapirobacteria bacterium]|nr:NUDIX hydrolase [Candidatus Shapirobacteria bacterium]